MDDIPKILHFIWLGGPIGNKREAIIAAWALSNPDWEVWIWIDTRHLLMNRARKTGTKTYATSKSAQEKMVAALVYFALFEDLVTMDSESAQSRAFGDGPPDLVSLQLYGASTGDYALRNGIQLDLVMGLKKRLKATNVRIKDVWHEEVMNKAGPFRGSPYAGAMELLYHAELTFRVNPGAAADFLRMFVLLNFGGLYLDVDIAPTKTPLVQLQCKKGMGLIAYYGKDTINNNAIAAPAGSLLMQAYIEQVFCNYLQFGAGRKVKQRSKFGVGMVSPSFVTHSSGYEGLFDIESLTANVSGPSAFLACIGQYFQIMSLSDIKNNLALPEKYFDYDTELSKTHDYVDSKNVDM